jgi:hypothetical protein
VQLVNVGVPAGTPTLTTRPGEAHPLNTWTVSRQFGPSVLNSRPGRRCRRPCDETPRPCRMFVDLGCLRGDP